MTYLTRARLLAPLALLALLWACGADPSPGQPGSDAGLVSSGEPSAAGDGGPLDDRLGAKLLGPCARAKCAAGSVCQEVPTKCKRDESCESLVAQCLSEAAIYQAACTPACAAGEVCHALSGGLSCVPEASKGESCGPVICGEGLVCCNESCGICTEEGGSCSKEKCDFDPCSGVRCDDGKHCEAADYECITTPCFAFECVDNPPSCDDLSCGEGTHCELIDVECKRPPCDQVAQCVANPDPCEAKACEDGQVCKLDEGGEAGCVAPSCADRTCPEGMTCDESSGTPRCVEPATCEGACDRGEYCSLETLPCLRAPCPQRPVCTEGTSPCVKACLGQACTVVDGRALCEPVPCGKNTCTNGQQCCNASCGTCVDPGGLCLQLACGIRVDLEVPILSP